VTLAQLLTFLGIAVGVVALVGALYVWWTSGSSAPPVPGAATFTTNIANAEELMTSLGQNPPTAVQCAQLRPWLTAAQTALVRCRLPAN
jgi:hypothetical protein